MERLLLCVVLTSLAFSFLASRNSQLIGYKIVIGLALSGSASLVLAGVIGGAVGQSPEATYFSPGHSNDMTMGVLFGVDLLYAAMLCLVWVVASHRGRAA
jgi:hypothetical protein